MMKSIQHRFRSHAPIQMFLALLMYASQAYGQPTGACGHAPESLPGSCLLTTPYRDMNPFEDLPGEINQWGWGTVYLQNR